MYGACLLYTSISIDRLFFYKKLEKVHSLEKQKSYARFFRKFLKKINGWNPKEELLSQYPNLFILLVTEFARLKKDTYISEELCELYNIFFNNNVQSVSCLLYTSRCV